MSTVRTWTPEEDAILGDLSRQLRGKGWAANVPIERLLANWESLASQVNDYRLTIDDFTNDLTSRDGLEGALDLCRLDSFRERLMAAVEASDQKYRAATEEDGGAALSKYFRVPPSAGWWWRRRPRSGPLAVFLSESAA